MHNEMARILANVVARIGDHYDDVISWVAPGLTHRSFVLARDERAFHHVSTSRKVGARRIELIGANDHPRDGTADCLSFQCPTTARTPLRVSVVASRSTFPVQRRSMRAAGANATPLALPELLDVLVRRLAHNPIHVDGKKSHDRVAAQDRR